MNRTTIGSSRVAAAPGLVLAGSLAMALAGSLALAAGAQETGSSAKSASRPTTAAATDTEAYRLGPEDVVEIFVWNEPDVSTTVVVRPDGMISIPLLNEIRASGRTPTEVRAEIAQGLLEYLDSPEVSVLVTEVNSAKVSVLGEVRDPGRFMLRQVTTVLDAVAMAGGFTEYADRGDIVVIRVSGTSIRRHRVDVNDVLSGDRSELLQLQAGDTVYVR